MLVVQDGQTHTIIVFLAFQSANLFGFYFPAQHQDLCFSAKYIIASQYCSTHTLPFFHLSEILPRHSFAGGLWFRQAHWSRSQDVDILWNPWVCGSRDYPQQGRNPIAPECLHCVEGICTCVFHSPQGHDLSADYWSLGILMFELLTGRWVCMQYLNFVGVKLCFGTQNGCFSIGPCIKQKRKLPDANYEIRKHCPDEDWSIQSKCWQGFSDFKVGIRELPFLFMSQKISLKWFHEFAFQTSLPHINQVYGCHVLKTRSIP